MLQKDLAKLLGISASMVSRLVKKGMPTDSVERAQRWRKRHLEPGRIKGARFDPTAAAEAVPRHDPAAILHELAAGADLLLLGATAFDDAPGVAEAVAPLRTALRQLPDDARPRLSLRCWLALLDWVLNEAAEVRNSSDQDAVLSPDEFARRVGAQIPTSGRHWLDLACDWRNFSETGLPDDDFDAATLAASYSEQDAPDMTGY